MKKRDRLLKLWHHPGLFVSLGLFLLAGPASAAMIILPRDAALVGGVYGGVARHEAKIETRSSAAGRSREYDAGAALAGILLGLEGKKYRVSTSFDRIEGGQTTQQRLFFNFDYMWGEECSAARFRPMIGAGIGSTESRYPSESGPRTFNTGSWALRGGFEYGLSADRSLELLLEYSRPFSSGSDSDFSDSHFAITELVEQQLLMLRIGYNFKVF
mgnify:CR=1 FL=1